MNCRTTFVFPFSMINLRHNVLDEFHHFHHLEFHKHVCWLIGQKLSVSLVCARLRNSGCWNKMTDGLTKLFIKGTLRQLFAQWHWYVAADGVERRLREEQDIRYTFLFPFSCSSFCWQETSQQATLITLISSGGRFQTPWISEGSPQIFWVVLMADQQSLAMASCRLYLSIKSVVV